ncbi:MAG: peptide ABC transporter permease, partial [Oceanicaulis sp.]|nr:peptide ABC transporter permease [Oceanicaulis sp.]HCR95482.1 peptide ABC transporter permease [Oceanicaulis sp.]
MVLTSTPQEKAELMEQSAVKGRSLWDDARTRLLRNKAAVASLILLGVLVLLALVGPLIWVHDSTFIYRDKVQIAPTLTDL